MEIVSRFVQFWQMYQFKIVAGVTGIKNIYIYSCQDIEELQSISEK